MRAEKLLLSNKLLLKKFLNKEITTLQLSKRSLSTTWKASYSPAKDNIVRSKAPDLQIPRKHFFDYLWDESVEKWGDRVCLIDGVTEQSFTYKESQRESLGFAAALSARFRPSKGDVLAALLPNCPEYAFLISGASLLGMPVTTVNPVYTSSELARQMEMSGTKFVVTVDAFVPRVVEAIGKLKDGKKSIKVISLDAKSDSEGAFAYKHMRQTNLKDFARETKFDFDDDLVTLPYSSGTTGLPKGVMLTHCNMVSNIAQGVFSAGFDFIRFPTESFQPSTVSVLPLYHIYGMNVTLFPTLHVGGKVVTLPKFEPVSFVKALEKYKPGFLHVAPPLFAFCANHPSVLPEHLASLHYIMVGAAPFGPALAQKFKEKAPHVIIKEGWGMTELSPIVLQTPSSEEVLGSCGRPLANTQMKVVDLSCGEALGPNQRGELCVKGPQVMKGYLNNPEATASTIKDGWLYSGDIAYYDEQERFYIVDRLKELIKVKGFQVAPAELENLLRSHPDILDVAVIGVPHEKFGEVPRAYIIKRNDALTEEQVNAFVNAEVSDYKRLVGGVEFTDVIPKSAAGKILRKDIIKAYEEKKRAQQ